MTLFNDSNKLKNTSDFFEIITENTQNYKGQYNEIIIHAPRIYKLLTLLLSSKNIEKEDRKLLTAAIAYFTIPNDIYPEDTWGAKGYIDDVLFSIHVINILKSKYEFELISEYWDGKPSELEELLGDKFNELKSEFKEIIIKISEYTGI